MPHFLPQGFHTVTPYLRVRDCPAAIEFYKKAFGAVELFRMPGPDGSIVHAEVRIGDSPVMMSEENPKWNALSPQAIGGTAVGIHLYVQDVDAMFNSAVAAGATVTMPPMDMFYGDRSARVTDPFGHDWTISTHKEDLTPQQLQERAAEAFKKMTC